MGMPALGLHREGLRTQGLERRMDRAGTPEEEERRNHQGQHTLARGRHMPSEAVLHSQRARRRRPARRTRLERRTRPGQAGSPGEGLPGSRPARRRVTGSMP